MNKAGHASIVVWATWDGEQQCGPQTPTRGFGGEPLSCPPHPSAPSVLVSLEGCGPELGKWTEPLKLYAFLEYGFKIGRYVETVAAVDEKPEETVDNFDDTTF